MSEPMTSPIRHSEACGVNPQTDCQDCKPHTIHLRTLEALEERLRKGGVPVRDLAELIWYWLEPLIGERIEAIANERAERKVMALLKTLNFTWNVEPWRNGND